MRRVAPTDSKAIAIFGPVEVALAIEVDDAEHAFRFQPVGFFHGFGALLIISPMIGSFFGAER